MILASFLQDSDFINACYIVAFILFIVGLQNLRKPTTAMAMPTAAIAFPRTAVRGPVSPLRP